MAIVTDQIVLLQRYTVLVGDAALFLPPMDVRAYDQAILTGWQGTGFGMSPATVEFTVQQSADLETWVHDAVITPQSAGDEETEGIGISLPWLRVKVQVSGLDPCVACWLRGEFVRRFSMIPVEGA